MRSGPMHACGAVTAQRDAASPLQQLLGPCTLSINCMQCKAATLTGSGRPSAPPLGCGRPQFPWPPWGVMMERSGCGGSPA